MTHFLIIYERRSRRVLEMLSFPDSDRDEALAARTDRELKYRQETDIEVVLLTAESREALQETHSRYFRTTSRLILDQIKKTLQLKPFVPLPGRGH